MENLIKELFSLPIPKFLIIVSVIFFLLSFVRSFSKKVSIGKNGRITAGIIGGTLLIIGLIMHIIDIPQQTVYINKNSNDANINRTIVKKSKNSSKLNIGNYEYATNRQGGDYKFFATKNLKQCSSTCYNEVRCLAFTYVKPGVQGINSMCWLKNIVPETSSDSCCISGIKMDL